MPPINIFRVLKGVLFGAVLLFVTLTLLAQGFVIII